MNKMDEVTEIMYTSDEVDKFIGIAQQAVQKKDDEAKKISEKNRLSRQKGAQRAAEVKRQQKEWFYENIWSPAYDDGRTLLENIIRDGEKKECCTRKDGFVCFNGIEKSENTLKKWHTEFRKRKKGS